jgi:hypothetical protein
MWVTAVGFDGKKREHSFVISQTSLEGTRVRWQFLDCMLYFRNLL